MTIFDYVVIGIVVASLLLGLWRGVVGELIALAAWVLAFFAAMEFGPQIAASLYGGVSDPAMRALAGYATVFVGVLVVMALVRLAIRGLIKALGLSLSDRILGVAFGVLRGVLICLVMVALGGLTVAPSKPWWQNASLAAPLETGVLAMKPWLPQDLAKRIRFR